MDLETAGFLEEASGETFTLRYQCGVCTGTCLWNLVRKFCIRRMVHQERLGLANFEEVYEAAFTPWEISDEAENMVSGD